MTPEPDAIAALMGHLDRIHGPLRRVSSKPYSLHYTDTERLVFLKIYRLIDPDGRRSREFEALHLAPHLGIRVPTVVGHGYRDGLAWITTELLSGQPLQLDRPEDVPGFLRAAQALLAPLHAHNLGTAGPGHGWTNTPQTTTSDFLASQLSDRTRRLDLWPRMRSQLEPLDRMPMVLLHGDVKPDHFLVPDDDTATALVDWEACARGPAALDDADIAFRIIRDLTYADVPDDAVQQTIRDITPQPAAMAWRLALWIDRRIDTETTELDALLTSISGLPTEAEPMRTATQIVKHARNLEVRY